MEADIFFVSIQRGFIWKSIRSTQRATKRYGNFDWIIHGQLVAKSNSVKGFSSNSKKDKISLCLPVFCHLCLGLTELGYWMFYLLCALY